MTTQITSLNPKYTWVHREDNQEISTIEIIMIREVIRIDIDLIVEIEGHHIEVEVSMDKIIEDDSIMSETMEMIIEEIISEIYKIIEVRILEVDTKRIIEMIILEEVGVDLGTDNIQIITEGMNDRSSSRSRSSSRTRNNRDRIRCYKCRKYNHFAKDCPTSQVGKESEQIQQMYNMDEEQIALKV